MFSLFIMVFAQLNGADSILSDQIEAAESISETFDDIWREEFLDNSGLTSIIFVPVTLFALFATGKGILGLAQEFNRSGTINWEWFIWPVICVSIITTDLSRTMPYALYRVGEESYLQLLTATGYQNSFRQAKALAGFKFAIAPKLRECQGFVGEKQRTCLQEASRRADALIAANRAAFGQGIPWVVRLANRWIDVAGALFNPSSDLFERGSAVAFSFLAPVWENITALLFAAWGRAFQIIVEVSALLGAYVFPFFVAASLSYESEKPIFGWITVQASLWMTKICYGIIVGISSNALLNTELSGSNLWWPVMLGLFAPILAVAMATGGGWAVWKSLGSAVGSAGTLFLRLKTGFLR